MSRWGGTLARLFLTAIVTIATASGCTVSTSDGEKADEVTRANQLIDKKQYSEAIYVLTERLKRSPADSRARVLLASAYAARAGIRLANYGNFAATIDKWNKLSELLDDGMEENLLQVVGKAFLRIQIVVKAFDALPVPSTSEGISDLGAALSVLDEGGELKGGPSLYRALLRVTLFKQQLKTVYRPRFAPACRISTRDLTAWLSAIAGQVGKIVDDVGGGLADPESKKRTMEFGARLKGHVVDVTSAVQLDGVNVDVPLVVRKAYLCE